jgi:hypothetical protein
VAQTETNSPEDRPFRYVPVRAPWWHRPLPVALAVLAVLLVALAAWIGLRAYQAATALRSVADAVGDVRGDITAGDTSGLAGPVARIEDDAARAVSATSDPVWRLAELVPVVGADARAVRTVAVAVDGLATDVLTPLVGVADGLSPASLRPVDGRIDLAPLEAAAPVLATATEAADRARRSVGELDPDELHGPLVEPVTELQGQLDTAGGALRQVSRLASLLPPMLGVDEPRSYLALFLNSAEVRTQGGIVGAIAVITVDDGRLELTQHASTLDIPEAAEPVLPLTDPELAITTDILGRHIQNVFMLPDTPRAGELAVEMWRRTTGQTVDGVLAIDPVALSYVLRATGEVRHPNGETLGADSLVQTLLFEAYERQEDPSESDAFFAGAATAAFEALADGRGDPRALMDALGQATDERRLSVWSAHPDEEEQISGTAVDGAFLSGGHDEAVGIFLDNSSGWKTDTFLRSTLTAESVTCTEGVLTMEVQLELASTLPADVSGMPLYVVGDGRTGVPPGTMRMRVSLYSPVDGAIEQVRRGESFIGAFGARIAGRQVQVMTETLAAGQTATYRFSVTAPAHGGEIPLWSTPTTSSTGLTSVPSSCAAS